MNNHNLNHHFLIALIAFVMSFGASAALANTPAEMAGFSLEQLLAMPAESDADDEDAKGGAWRIGLLYKKLKLDGYQDGTDEVDNEDVLFSGGTRTDKNFPVVPTVIEQEVWLINVSYIIDSDNRINISVPYIFQGTDHISSVANYDEFLIESEGIGDITLGYDQVIKRWEGQTLTLGTGMSFPTGSIDEEGDTPRNSGKPEEQLPYTMQTGSGTLDFPFSLRYQKNKSERSWGSTLSGTIRTGQNDRDYRLGHRLGVSLWGKWLRDRVISPSAKLQYQWWDSVQGQDDEITLENNKQFPYPAAITNPDFFGGSKVNASVGFELPLGDHALAFEVGKPVYQNLNGIQNKEVMHSTLSWNSTF